eukprot:gene2085-2363_t
MDRGVIRSLKAYYKTISVRKLIQAIDGSKQPPAFSILDAMKMLDLAWEKVKEEPLSSALQKQAFHKSNKTKHCRKEMILSKNSKSGWMNLLFGHLSSFQKGQQQETCCLLMKVLLPQKILSPKDIIEARLERNDDAEEDDGCDDDVLEEPRWGFCKNTTFSVHRVERSKEILIRLQ